MPVIRSYYILAELFDWKSIVANAESANRMSIHEVIREPTDSDILHSKDNFSIYHIGNRCFHAVISYSFPQYLVLPNRSEKGKFLSAIVNTIYNSEVNSYTYEHMAEDGNKMMSIGQTRQLGMHFKMPRRNWRYSMNHHSSMGLIFSDVTTHNMTLIGEA